MPPYELYTGPVGDGQYSSFGQYLLHAHSSFVAIVACVSKHNRCCDTHIPAMNIIGSPTATTLKLKAIH